MRNIEEIYFCPHTLECFFRLTERDKEVFNYIYPFQVVYCRVNQTVLTVCFDCQELVVKDYNSQASCFQKYFPEKKLFRLRRSCSVKNVTLEGKTVISYCHGHDTIIMFFFFEGYQEKFVKL